MKKKTYITPVTENVFLYENLCQTGIGYTGSIYNDEDDGNFAKSNSFIDDEDDSFNFNVFDDADDWDKLTNTKIF